MTSTNKFLGRTATEKLRFKYWSALQELMQRRQGNVQLTTPYFTHWITFSFRIREIKSGEFQLLANFTIRKNLVTACLLIKGDNAEAHFYLLRKEREEIEQELGETLEWDPRPNARSCFVSISRTVSDLEDQSIWSDLLKWQYERLEDLHRVFAPRIKTLDASDYIPGETDFDDTEEDLG